MSIEGFFVWQKEDFRRAIAMVFLSPKIVPQDLIPHTASVHSHSMLLNNWKIPLKISNGCFTAVWWSLTDTKCVAGGKVLRTGIASTACEISPAVHTKLKRLYMSVSPSSSSSLSSCLTGLQVFQLPDFLVVGYTNFYCAFGQFWLFTL